MIIIFFIFHKFLTVKKIFDQNNNNKCSIGECNHLLFIWMAFTTSLEKLLIIQNKTHLTNTSFFLVFKKYYTCVKAKLLFC
jgi:hypothetical protein